MSTKIYDGYRVYTRSIGRLNDVLADFRARLTPVAQAAYNEVFAQRVALYADARIVGQPVMIQTGIKREHEEDATINPAASAWLEIWDAKRRIKLTSLRDPFFDFDCELQVYPGNPWTFVIYTAEQRAYDLVWETTDGVGAYPYWNNTDRPEELTERQWQQRGDQWYRRLDSHGLRWSLYNDDSGPIPVQGDELLATMPSFEDRLKRIAHVVVHASGPSEELKAQVESAKGDGYTGFALVAQWMRSAEYKALLMLEQDRLRDLIPPTLTIDHLLGKDAPHASAA